MLLIGIRHGSFLSFEIREMFQIKTNVKEESYNDSRLQCGNKSCFDFKNAVNHIISTIKSMNTNI